MNNVHSIYVIKYRFQVLWVPFDSVSGASSELVSADCGGDIALWDVCRGRCISWMDSEQIKPVIGNVFHLLDH